MMTYARNIARHDFKSNVLEAQDGKLDLVDFWAPWCGPCKTMEPILEKLARELEYKVDIYKINVDDEPEIASLVGVRSIPTLIFFKNGKKVDLFVGAVTEQFLKQQIQKHM